MQNNLHPEFYKIVFMNLIWRSIVVLHIAYYFLILYVSKWALVAVTSGSIMVRSHWCMDVYAVATSPVLPPTSCHFVWHFHWSVSSGLSTSHHEYLLSQYDSIKWKKKLARNVIPCTLSPNTLSLGASSPFHSLSLPRYPHPLRNCLGFEAGRSLLLWEYAYTFII